LSKEKQIAFLKLYEPIHAKFEKFCRARVYGRMEYSDLMNETLLVAYSKFDSIKNKTSLLSFLCGTAIKLLANDNRKLKPKQISDAKQLIVIDTNANTDKDLNVSLLYKAMDFLPVEQKECLILFEILGFSIKEIIEIQNSSESAVKQRLRRGRLRLNEILTFESKHKRGEVDYEK